MDKSGCTTLLRDLGIAPHMLTAMEGVMLAAACNAAHATIGPNAHGAASWAQHCTTTCTPAGGSTSGIRHSLESSSRIVDNMPAEKGCAQVGAGAGALASACEVWKEPAPLTYTGGEPIDPRESTGRRRRMQVASIVKGAMRGISKHEL